MEEERIQQFIDELDTMYRDVVLNDAIVWHSVTSIKKAELQSFERLRRLLAQRRVDVLTRLDTAVQQSRAHLLEDGCPMDPPMCAHVINNAPGLQLYSHFVASFATLMKRWESSPQGAIPGMHAFVYLSRCLSRPAIYNIVWFDALTQDAMVDILLLSSSSRGSG